MSVSLVSSARLASRFGHQSIAPQYQSRCCDEIIMYALWASAGSAMKSGSFQIETLKRAWSRAIERRLPPVFRGLPHLLEPPGATRSPHRGVVGSFGVPLRERRRGVLGAASDTLEAVPVGLHAAA